MPIDVERFDFTGKVVRATYSPTHEELTYRAVRWLRGTARCSVVARELVSTSFEVPDAIGWQCLKSILVECKATRADFLADAKKPHRKYPNMGMGQFRYYMAPAGLIDLDELPTKWGLLEARKRIVRVRRRAVSFPAAAAALAERRLLFRMLREQEG